MTLLYILLSLAIVGIGFIAYQQWTARTGGDPLLQAELDRRIQEIGEIKSQLEQLKAERNEIATNGKNTFAQLKNMESDYKALMKERDALSVRISKYEAEESRKEKDFERKLSELESARNSLVQERSRVIKEDEERTQEELAARDRMWNEHENTVNALLGDLCKTPQYSFTSYDNTNLPDGFDGSLKPDFLIDFLGQYIIFDSKVSRSDNFQNYIATNVKSTAKKLKDKAEIYPTVFFVVPTEAIPELKTTYFFEQGLSFYVISPEALPPILAALKKITTYELADQLDPQERENIVTLVADLDSHINYQNGINLIMTKHGIDILNKAKRLDSGLIEDVEERKKTMRLPSLNPSEIKKLHRSTEEQESELLNIINPEASVSEAMLEKARLAMNKD